MIKYYKNMEKKCSKCHIKKDIEEFNNQISSKDGKHIWCRSCNSEYYKQRNKDGKIVQTYNYEGDRNVKLKRKYGITLLDYNNMFKKQNGCCAVCGTANLGKRSVFHIDHCHKTGKVRGLLCSNCNSEIGNLRDSVDLLYKAISYLQEYSLKMLVS